MSNHSKIFYISETGDCYLKDATSGDDCKLPYRSSFGWPQAKITDTSIFLSDGRTRIPKNNNPNLLNPTWVVVSPNTRGSIWREISHHSDVNNAGWVVGEGVTIYGESHALLIRPVKVEGDVSEPLQNSCPCSRN